MRKLLACFAVGVVVFGGALAACGGDDDGGGSQQAFCDSLKNGVSAFSDLSDQSDLTNTESQSRAQAAFDDLADKAPDEIKSDMQAIARAAKSLFDSVDEVSSAVSESDFSRLSDLEQSFSDQNSGIERASENVEKFAKDKCGIDISGSGATSSSSDRFSDLSDLSNLSDFSDFSDFSDLSSLSDLSDFTSNFSDLSSLTDLSELGSELSSLFSR